MIGAACVIGLSAVMYLCGVALVAYGIEFGRTLTLLAGVGVGAALVHLYRLRKARRELRMLSNE